MRDILLWQIDSSVINKIDIMAKKKGLSRNDFIVSYLNHIAEIDTLFCVFNRYEILLKRVEESLEQNREVIERINF